MNKIAITAIATLSPLGKTAEEIWSFYKNEHTAFTKQTHNGNDVFVAAIQPKDRICLDEIRNSDPKYKGLDDTVIFALYTSRQAIATAQWNKNNSFGVNFGSSRGATALFEKEHAYFMSHQKANTLSSPTTTLGNISSWVCHDLKTQGPDISHSITCSTALHSVLNGIAWIKAGMSDSFLVGGSEAPLTSFTIAQMQALKIYALTSEKEFPCEALSLDKSKNSMILGEGAGAICLEKSDSNNVIAYIAGVGYATEILKHNISISEDAICFQKSMRMALKDAELDHVDVIVMHAPGTIKGDLSEYKAIETIFNKIPALTTNKWKMGHTFGASGIFNIELAILMLQHQELIESPFYTNKKPDTIKTIMVNAVGFGGNAVSLIISL